MDIKEACRLLEVDETISDEDLKAKYKSLAKIYHPDIHKDDPNKFKTINEAYDLIKDYRANPNKYNQTPQWTNIPIDFGNFSSMFDINHSRQQRAVAPPSVNINISFKESILGCEKEIQYNRNIKCNPCNGNGTTRNKNDCKFCDGFGRITSSAQGMVFSTTCGKCYGRGVSKSQCANCSGEGSVKTELKGNVNIPPGTNENSTLILRGKGHYSGQSPFGENYTDTYLNIFVSPEDGLKLIGKEVVSNLNISLLEALTGCNKEVNTIHGNKPIQIQSSTKNKDEITIPNHGVQNHPQRVIINIDYPTNTQSLIDLLKQGLN